MIIIATSTTIRGGRGARSSRTGTSRNKTKVRKKYEDCDEHEGQDRISY